jgi:hypothetical protein
MTLTRVYFENGGIQMDGLTPYPARSLMSALDGDRVLIHTLAGYPVSALTYDLYANKAGASFASAAAAKAYLDGEFAKIEPVPAHTHSWGDITGKPNLFPPSAHTHLWADLTDKPSTFPPAAHTHSWTDVTGKPAIYPPAAHTHLWTDITDRPTIPAPTPLGLASPKPLGTGAAGSSGNAAREDHVHPAVAVPVLLPNVTATGTIVLGAVSGPKKHVLACVGAKLGDRLLMTPVDTMPAGYMLGDIRCNAADQVEITVQIPAVVATYSIPIAVTALRPVT